MLTYVLKKTPGVPMYESLYRCIRGDILSGKLQPGEKLPSKRSLAAHLEVSKITVEGAYDQLLAEGYIYSREKIGYFVEAVERIRSETPPTVAPPAEESWDVDLTANGSTDFPFSVWSRLQREVMLDRQEQLLLPMPNQGVWELRCAIAEHLASFRGMQIRPENILVGAGTDFLYNLLIQLLGRHKVYAVEEPGYGKIRKIYAAGGVKCVAAPMDSSGVMPQGLEEAQVLHISPSHHFPSGLVTPPRRRAELLRWAKERPDRYIIEDDYDSEFRFDTHPILSMESLDGEGKVIYMNTFSKTLAPSIRISYMVLPEQLMEQFRRELGFYSCTVPSFEQYTLERFLRGGYFEKHINRMRKTYRQRRNQIISMLQRSSLSERFTILEQDAGLHFLLRVHTDYSDEALVAMCAREGIRVLPLSSYYHGAIPQETKNCLVINYSALTPEKIALLEAKLKQLAQVAGAL